MHVKSCAASRDFGDFFSKAQSDKVDNKVIFLDKSW